jgi:hypothetical protein
MSTAPRRKLVSLVLSVLFAGLTEIAFAQTPTPLAPNSIQVSRVQYDGNSGNAYVSPYGFPEIFNDPAGLTTGNEIQDIAGIQGSIYIDQFNSVPWNATLGTLSLPSTGTPVTSDPVPEPASYITTSFSSKSEGALMLSLDGSALTYMGYLANDQLDDVSNSYSLNPNYELSPNTYTYSPNLGTPINIVSASDTSKGAATITLSAPVTYASGAYFTIANMTTAGYNGTWALSAAVNNSPTLSFSGLPDSLASCSSTGTPCGGNATYLEPYPFYDREVALIQAGPTVTLTPIDNTNSGDNPRAALTIDENEFYIVGNSDSTEASPSTGPNNPGLTIGARCGAPENNVTFQFGTYTAADRPDESAKKHVKDNNWRGVGIYTDGNGNQQLYVSKGSGGNGDDGFFQVGAGLPACTAGLIATGGTNYNAGNTITELFGAQATVPDGQPYQTSPYLPFGFWFANPTTLYVADEGNPPTYVGGSSPSFSNSTNGTFTLPQLANGSFAADPYAGLEKWSLVNGTWQYDYTIQAGLNLYQPTAVTGYNDINGNPISSYPYGIRNMTGYNNNDGTVTIYAITAQFSAVSGGEPDPTSLVGVTDSLAATALPATEQFVTIQTSAPGEVFRGVAYVAPGAGFTRQTQTITFPSVGQQTFGGPPVTLTASATSGWPIAYTVVSGPATVAGNVLTLTGAGSVVVEADQTGNTDYSAAPSVQQTIAVAQETPTITWNTPAPITYGTPLSGLQLDASANVTGTFSYTPASGTVLNGGTQQLSVLFTPTDTTDYTTASASVYILVNPASQTVSFTTNAPSSAVYGTSFTVAGTATSGLAVAYGSGGSCSNSGATYTMTSGTGTCTVTISQPGNANYSPASPVSESTSATPASQTITVTTPAPGTAVYGTSFTVVASASSGLAIVYGSAGSCTNSGATYTMTSGTGTCSVTLSQPGNSDYTAATPITESTAAQRANPTVTFTGAPAAAPFQSTFVMVATTNSTAVAYITVNKPTICQLSGPYSPVTVTMLKASGVCTFTATWGADQNYNPATLTQQTTAAKATPVVTWSTPAAITYGTPLSATQLDATANVAGTFKYSPAAGAILNAGTEALSVTFAPSASADYVDAHAAVEQQVVQASTTTKFNSTKETVTMNKDGIATALLNFTVSSYLPTGTVTLTASTGEQCSGAVKAETGSGGCKLTFVTTGTRTVSATYGGDANHLGSTSTVDSTVTVNPY